MQNRRYLNVKNRKTWPREMSYCWPRHFWYDLKFVFNNLQRKNSEGKKYEDISPSTHNMTVPVVTLKTYTLLNVDVSFFLNMLKKRQAFF